MCGTAGKVMRVERVPLKMGERVPGPPSLSPGLPAIPVLHPGLEHPRPLPCMGASRGATGASQVSDWGNGSKEASKKGGSLEGERPTGWGPRRRTLQIAPRTFTLFFNVLASLYRSWHSAPGSLSLLQAAPGRMGRRWAASVKTSGACARGGLGG